MVSLHHAPLIQASSCRPERDSVDMGEGFDFDDPDEMHRRLPRLAALYLTPRAVP